jgi:hypothetical protein
VYSNFIAIFVSLEVKQDLNAISAVCILFDAGDGLHDRVGHRDSRLSRQATQSAASSISQQLGTPRCGPRKSFLTEAIMQIVRRSWLRTEKSLILRAQPRVGSSTPCDPSAPCILGVYTIRIFNIELHIGSISSAVCQYS